MKKKTKKKLQAAQEIQKTTNLKTQKAPLPANTLNFFSQKSILLCSILAALAFILYGSSFNYDFSYDDEAVVKLNRFVQNGFDGIKDILTTQYFAGYDPHVNAMAYRPVPLITFAIENELFGEGPQSHHVVNILLYALSGIVLFFTLQNLWKKFHYSLPFVISILFITHPIHVDVVANIKSRDELLGFFNFLISFFLLLKYLDKPSYPKLGLSLFFYFLALASKESLLTSLAIIPLTIYFFRDYDWKKVLRITIPYAVVFIIFLLIRRSIIGDDHGYSQIKYIDNPLLAATTINERIGTNIIVMGMYLKSLIFPYQLSCDYSYNSIPLTGMSNPRVIFYLFGYLLLGFIALKGFARKTIWSYVILYFFITISIVSSIFIMSSNAYADRFLYFPSLSICITVGFLLYRLKDWKVANPNKNFFSFYIGNIIPFALFAVIIILFSYKTLSYVPVWKNNLALYSYNANLIPENARMQKNLGSEYVRLSVENTDSAEKRALAVKGISFLEKGLKIYPEQSVGWINLGNAFLVLKDYAKAEENLSHALQIDPLDRSALNSLGYTQYMTGRYKEAAITWEKIDPAIRDQMNNYNLYLAYSMLGDEKKATYYKQLSGK